MESASQHRCICCGRIAEDWHHRQPKSQDGGNERDNLKPVCAECHRIYNILNQTLSPKVKARVRNFMRWITEWHMDPEVSDIRDLWGGRAGQHPAEMAPPFLLGEAGYWMLTGGLFYDFSDNCLSQIAPIEEFKVRDHLRKAR